MQVPLLGQTGELADGKLAFLLPHEVLAATVHASPEGPGLFEEMEGLDETNFAHMAGLMVTWGSAVIPLSFWQDGVPYNWDRSESLEVYSWSLPGLASEKGRAFRFPVVVCPQHRCAKETHTQVLRILAWSLGKMARDRPFRRGMEEQREGGFRILGGMR